MSSPPTLLRPLGSTDRDFHTTADKAAAKSTYKPIGKSANKTLVKRTELGREV